MAVVIVIFEALEIFIKPKSIIMKQTAVPQKLNEEYMNVTKILTVFFLLLMLLFPNIFLYNTVKT